MRKSSCIAAAATLLATAALPVTGQTGPRIQVTPTLGAYVPLEDIGAVAPTLALATSDPLLGSFGGGLPSAWYLRLDRVDAAPAFGLNAQIGLVGTTLSARVRGLATLPADATGAFQCYPGLACPAVLLLSTAEVWMLSGMADLVYTPGLHHAIRPYALAGAGVRRYDYSWPAAAVMVAGGDYSEVTPALHAGLGLEFDAFGVTFQTEVVNYRSMKGEAILGPEGADAANAPRRHAQDDIAVSFGWRLIGF